jgi:hypothetical protein
MIFSVQHGYFICREEYSGEVAEFNSRYDQDLVAKDDYYTFSLLRDAQDYSIKFLPYLGVIATKTYHGPVPEIMRQNGLTYNFFTGFVQPMATVGIVASFIRRYTVYTSRGLIIPGSLTETGEIIKGYQCRYDSSSLNFNYTELFYE